VHARVVWAGRKQKRIQRFGADGQRERWTADDEANPDLQTLLKRQKHEVRLDSRRGHTSVLVFSLPSTSRQVAVQIQNHLSAIAPCHSLKKATCAASY
jgi:hypothetical protein